MVTAASNSDTLRGSLLSKACALRTLGARPVPLAWWQTAVQLLSSACGPPLVAPLPWPAPVAKFTSSWHEPHAARDALVFHASTSAPLPWWHLVQFCTIAGKPTSHHSVSVFL